MILFLVWTPKERIYTYRSDTKSGTGQTQTETAYRSDYKSSGIRPLLTDTNDKILDLTVAGNA